MTPRWSRGFAFALTALSLSACVGNMSWKTIKDSPAPSRFVVAPNGDVWGTGKVVMRRSGGSWTVLDMCGTYAKSLYYTGNKAETDVAFGADGDTWVLCGNTSMEGQALLHYDASATATVVTLPDDTDLQLVQLDGDVALLGKANLFQHMGATFMSVGAAAPSMSGVASSSAGHAIDDLYAPSGSGVGLIHWNGTAWLPVVKPADYTNAETGPPILRAGHIYSGPLELVGEVATPVVHDNAVGLARGLRALGAVDSSSAIFLGTAPHDSEFATNVAYFWYGKSGDHDFEFMGDAPFFSGSLYSAGGQSGFAVDANTILILNLSSATSATLLEGTR